MGGSEDLRPAIIVLRIKVGQFGLASNLDYPYDLRPFYELTAWAESVMMVVRLPAVLGQGNLLSPVFVVEPVAAVLGEGYRLHFGKGPLNLAI